MLDDALFAFHQGWAVVPGSTVDAGGSCSCGKERDCDRPGKHPRVRWLAYQEKRPTEQEVRSWWRRWPQANVIVLTGKVSGIVAIDVDPRHGGDESMVGVTIPDTVRTLTGGGGVHHIYRHPGRHLPNATNVLPGVDFRGDGGYILVPRSSHISGTRYEWDTSAHPEDIEPADLPPWFLDALDSGTRYAAGTHTVRKNGDVDAVIMGEIKVAEGERNEMMTRVVGSLISNRDEEEKGEESIVMLAMLINERSFDPPLAEGEVRTIVQSILRREQRKVRAADDARRMIIDDTVRVEQDEIEPEDRIETVRALWKEVGVAPVSDWFALIDSDGVNYMLVTPENEIRLGSDLLDYLAIRRILLNHITVLMPSGKKPPDWDRRALRLRQLAREDVVETIRASEQVDEWVGDYIQASPPQVDPAPDMRKEYFTSGPLMVDGELWLRSPSLARFVERTYGEKVEPKKVGRLLKRAGWETGYLADGDGGSIRGWRKGA